MAAILGLDDEQVIELCRHGSEDRVVSAANFNSPGQVVVAGHADAVDAVIERAKEEGARRAMRLAVSVPSHCSLMRSAADEFTQALDALEIQQPEIPVVHNVSADVADSPVRHGAHQRSLQIDSTGVRKTGPLGDLFAHPTSTIRDAHELDAERVVPCQTACGSAR